MGLKLFRSCFEQGKNGCCCKGMGRTMSLRDFLVGFLHELKYNFP